MEAQIEAIKANTALTEQQRKTEEKRTLQEGLLNIGTAYAKLGIGGSGVGAEIEINIDIEKYYEMLQKGKSTKEIADEMLKDQEQEREKYKKDEDEEPNIGLLSFFGCSSNTIFFLHRARRGYFLPSHLPDRGASFCSCI